MMRKEKHQFAIYYKDLPAVAVGKKLSILDEEIVRRVLSVLRLSAKDSCVFFSDSVVVTCLLTDIKKRNFDCVVQVVEPVRAVEPSVTLLLPLLKREALESAIYSATAMGVNVIQLVMTEKSLTWGGAKEMNRLYRVAISAAEQSKQYAVPNIKIPKKLEMLLQESLSFSCKLHADVEGNSLINLSASFAIAKDFLLSVGPEGDLTKEERVSMQSAGFTFCRLTPTVLKAEEAARLLIGIVRSFT